MKVIAIVNTLLEAEEAEAAERYLRSLPPRFDAEEVLEKLSYELSADLAHPAEKRAFLAWLKENENLFPDVAKAQAVAAANDYWDTDSDDDMAAFFEAIGFPQTDPTCPRCDGTGDEPGAPYDQDDDGNVLRPLCDRCEGSGKRLISCECDNTHEGAGAVCRWCWARGRRKPTDPEISRPATAG